MPECGDRLGRHALDVGGAGDVGGDRVHRVAGACRRGGDLVVALGTAAGDGHGRPRGRETERERLAETLVAAGDQGGAAGEVER